MGNKVSVEKSGSRRTGNQWSAPAHIYGNDLLRPETEWKACQSICESTQCENNEEQRFRYPELRASRGFSPLQARGEEPWKAEEARDMRHRQEEDLKATQEQNRQLEEQRRLDLELQQKRAREEEQRKADEEARINRQHLNQQLQALRERERRRQEEAVAPSLCLSLPAACRQHNTRRGCEDQHCRRLHICRPFLAAICNYGVTCRYSHSLTTAHNLAICSKYNLDTTRELVMVQQLRRAFQESGEMTEGMFKNNVQICFKVFSKNCDWHRCNRVHICRKFVAGHCERTDCKFGHELRATHNIGVLSRHRMTQMSDHEILDILRQNEKRRTQLVSRAAVGASSAKNGVNSAKIGASSAKNGAIPRQHKSLSDGYTPNKPSKPNTPSQPSQPSLPSQPSQPTDGISEELQCPVCLEMFRKATTLGCGHTFCACCLQEVRDKGVDRCPVCCSPISSFIRSVALDNIIRSMAAKQ